MTLKKIKTCLNLIPKLFWLAIFPWYRKSGNMGNQRSSNTIETNFEKIQQKFTKL